MVRCKYRTSPSPLPSTANICMQCSSCVNSALSVGTANCCCCSPAPIMKGAFICRNWGFHGGGYEECHLLGHKHTVLSTQETHYVFATEPSRLMLCKIWGFHGGDYEECPLLGYKHPVRSSQETHYVSATDSQLMLCTIWDFHGGDYEECPLLGCRNPVRSSQETQ
jgi:hypothetical protein